MSTQVADLRALLAERFPNAVPATPGTARALATGIPELDRALPNGGFPRGRLSAWQPGGGASAILRSACSAVLRQSERAVWVDGRHAFSGDTWLPGLILLRPPDRAAALQCAEEMARTGGVAVVVVDGAQANRTERQRLSVAANDGGAAVVLLERDGRLAGGVRGASRCRPEEMEWARGPTGEPIKVRSVLVRASVASMGWSREAAFRLQVSVPTGRTSPEAALPGRRGA